MQWHKDTPKKPRSTPSIQWHARHVADTASRRDTLRRALRDATLAHNLALMGLRRRVTK